MDNQNPVERLFKEVRPKGDSLDDVFDIIGKFGLRNLGYDGDFGLNPGYMFRGEIAYGPPGSFPLQSRLEREAIKQEHSQVGQLQVTGLKTRISLQCAFASPTNMLRV